MEEFDFELDSDVGTKVSKLKHTETDIDYDKINEMIRTSETQNNIKYQQPTNITYTNQLRPKKEINMNNFVRNLELNLDKISNIEEPKPVNFTNNMINKKPLYVEQFVETSTNQSNEEIKMTSITKYIDIVLYILLFMLLNNKFIIETVYDRVPYMKSLNSPFPNLLLRSLLFGVFLVLIKKFNI